MTQDEIFEMAREAGGSNVGGHGWTTWVGTQSTEFLERFAKLVAAKAIAELESQEPVEDVVAYHADGTRTVRIAPQRTWVGLTLTQVKLLGEGVQEEAIKSGHSRDWVFYTHINEALKEKNT